MLGHKGTVNFDKDLVLNLSVAYTPVWIYLIGLALF